jgi:hypothetical protein
LISSKLGVGFGVVEFVEEVEDLELDGGGESVEEERENDGRVSLCSFR